MTTSNNSQPQAAEEAKHTPAERLYDLAVIRTDSTQRKLTGYPMTHAECVTMKSKYSEEEQARIIFVPARPVDPDHGEQGNHEAELIREITFLKEKLLVAANAQETIWKANIALAQQLRESHESRLRACNAYDSDQRELSRLRARVAELEGKK